MQSQNEMQTATMMGWSKTND